MHVSKGGWALCLAQLGPAEDICPRANADSSVGAGKIFPVFQNKAFNPWGKKKPQNYLQTVHEGVSEVRNFARPRILSYPSCCFSASSEFVKQCWCCWGMNYGKQFYDTMILSLSSATATGIQLIAVDLGVGFSELWNRKKNLFVIFMLWKDKESSAAMEAKFQFGSAGVGLLTLLSRFPNLSYHSLQRKLNHTTCAQGIKRTRRMSLSGESKCTRAVKE